MRNDSLDVIMNHLFETPTKRTELAPADKELLERIEYCYTMQLSNPLYTDIQVRNSLMNHFGLSRQQAYNIMSMTKVALGNVQTAGKAWIKFKIAHLLDKSAEYAIDGDIKTSNALTKIAEVWGRTYRTDLDDGDLLDAKKFVQIEKVEIVTDPTFINVQVTDKDREETRKLLEKYHINFDDDVIQEAEYVNADESSVSA